MASSIPSQTSRTRLEPVSVPGSTAEQRSLTDCNSIGGSALGTPLSMAILASKPTSFDEPPTWMRTESSSGHRLVMTSVSGRGD